MIHWSRVTHICVSKLTIFGSDNGLSQGRCPNVGILLMRLLGVNSGEILLLHPRKCIWKCRLRNDAKDVSASRCYGPCPQTYLHHHVRYGMSHLRLTHWGRRKIVAISQTTFSNAFSWIKTYEFRLRFHWNLFLRFELTMFQHWFW